MHIQQVKSENQTRHINSEPPSRSFQCRRLIRLTNQTYFFFDLTTAVGLRGLYQHLTLPNLTGGLQHDSLWTKKGLVLRVQ